MCATRGSIPSERKSDSVTTGTAGAAPAPPDDGREQPDHRSEPSTGAPVAASTSLPILIDAPGNAVEHTTLIPLHPRPTTCAAKLLLSARQPRSGSSAAAHTLRGPSDTTPPFPGVMSLGRSIRGPRPGDDFFETRPTISTRSSEPIAVNFSSGSSSAQAGEKVSRTPVKRVTMKPNNLLLQTISLFPSARPNYPRSIFEGEVKR